MPLTSPSKTALKLSKLAKLLFLPLLVFLLSALISQYFTSQAEQKNSKRIQQEMNQRLQQLSAEVAEKITFYQYGLRGMRSAVLGSGVDNLNYDIILNYSASRDIDIDSLVPVVLALFAISRQHNWPTFLISLKLNELVSLSCRTLNSQTDSILLFNMLNLKFIITALLA